METRWSELRSTLGFEIRRCTYSVTSRTQRCYVNLIVGMAGWHASVTLTPPDRYSPRWRGGEIFQTATRRGIPLPRKTSTTQRTLFTTLIQLSLQLSLPIEAKSIASPSAEDLDSNLQRRVDRFPRERCPIDFLRSRVKIWVKRG